MAQNDFPEAKDAQYRVESIYQVSNEFLGQLRQWLEQAGLAIPIKQTLGYGSAVPTSDASYVTVGASSNLDNERIITAGSGITLTDGGAGGTLTIAVNVPKVKTFEVDDPNTSLATGDGQFIFAIDTSLNGLNLTAAHAYVTTVSSSGTPTIQIRNITQAADMLTTRITIDANEFTSYTAATAPVIDTGNDDVATGDLIAVDVDVAGTGTKGLGVILTFQ